MGSVADARRDFGAGSMIETMVGAFRRQNPIGELWAVALDDAAGAAQKETTITVSSAATGAGTIALYIAGRRVAVGIDGAMTTAQVATAINTALTNLGAALPVTSAVAGAVVTITARNGGAASDIDVRANYFADDAYPPGVALAFAVSTAGATDPDIQDRPRRSERWQVRHRRSPVQRDRVDGNARVRADPTLGPAPPG